MGIWDTLYGENSFVSKVPYYNEFLAGLMRRKTGDRLDDWSSEGTPADYDRMSSEDKLKWINLQRSKGDIRRKKFNKPVSEGGHGFGIEGEEQMIEGIPKLFPEKGAVNKGMWNAIDAVKYGLGTGGAGVLYGLTKPLHEVGWVHESVPARFKRQAAAGLEGLSKVYDPDALKFVATGEGDMGGIGGYGEERELDRHDPLKHELDKQLVNYRGPKDMWGSDHYSKERADFHKYLDQTDSDEWQFADYHRRHGGNIDDLERWESEYVEDIPDSEGYETMQEEIRDKHGGGHAATVDLAYEVGPIAADMAIGQWMTPFGYLKHKNMLRSSKSVDDFAKVISKYTGKPSKMKPRSSKRLKKLKERKYKQDKAAEKRALDARWHDRKGI